MGRIMIYNKKVLALIPARGGSKGIKNKNIVDLGGLPLIVYSIRAAKASNYIDDVIVSTDSLEIQKISNRYGAETPFIRPQEQASDTATTLDAVLHSLKTLEMQGRVYDILVLLQPTSPLRTVEDIDGAVELFEKVGEEGVAAISEASDPPVLMRKVMDDGRMKRFLNKNSSVRRQDMDKVYRINGSIYINLISKVNEYTSFNDNPVGYIMEKSHAVDIDELVDLEVAKYYMGIVCKD